MTKLLDAINEQITELEEIVEKLNEGDWGFSEGGDWLQSHGGDEIISLLKRVASELEGAK